MSTFKRNPAHLSIKSVEAFCIGFKSCFVKIIISTSLSTSCLFKGNYIIPFFDILVSNLNTGIIRFSQRYKILLNLFQQFHKKGYNTRPTAIICTCKEIFSVYLLYSLEVLHPSPTKCWHVLHRRLTFFGISICHL